MNLRDLDIGGVRLFDVNRDPSSVGLSLSDGFVVFSYMRMEKV